jgi:hypothetical protein
MPEMEKLTLQQITQTPILRLEPLGWNLLKHSRSQLDASISLHPHDSANITTPFEHSIPLWFVVAVAWKYPEYAKG